MLLLLKTAAAAIETWRGKKIGDLTHSEALKALHSMGQSYTRKLMQGGSFTPSKNLPTKTRGRWIVFKEFTFK